VNDIWRSKRVPGLRVAAGDRIAGKERHDDELQSDQRAGR
jgi:hypothetical protein